MSIAIFCRARRARERGDEAGFTLIELLVVVLIIGILAAIAIPVYLGIQGNAKDTAAKSDLNTAKTAALSFYATNSTWSTISSTASVNAAATQTGGAGGFKPFGWASTAAVDGSTTAGGTPAGFCIKQQSTSSGSPWFYVTQDVAPTSSKPAGCA